MIKSQLDKSVKVLRYKQRKETEVPKGEQFRKESKKGIMETKNWLWFFRLCVQSDLADDLFVFVILLYKCDASERRSGQYYVSCDKGN